MTLNGGGQAGLAGTLQGTLGSPETAWSHRCPGMWSTRPCRYKRNSEEPTERREEKRQDQAWGAMLNVPGNHFSALLIQNALPLAPTGKPFHTFTLSQIVPFTSFSTIINSVLRIICMTIHSFFTRKMKWSEVKSLSRVQLFVIPWTVAHQAPPSMGFSRQEYWSGLPFSYPGDLPNPGIEPRSPHCRKMLLPSEPPVKPKNNMPMYYIGLLGTDCPSTHKNPHSLWRGQEKPHLLFYVLTVLAMELAQVTSSNAQPSTPLTNNILWSSPFLAPPDIWEAKKHCWHDCKEYNHIFKFFSYRQIDCCQHMSFLLIGHFQWVCLCIFFHSAALLLGFPKS